MKKLLVIQPYIAKYRIPVFQTLAKSYDMTVAACIAEDNKGYGQPDASTRFKFITLKFKNKFGFLWQSGIRKLLADHPDGVFIAANPRHLSYWYTLLYCLLFRIPIFCHGQGPYNKSALSFLRRFLYRMELLLATRYICYTEYSRQAFHRLGLQSDKLAVADNSLHLKRVRKLPEHIPPGLHVMFIGRLRPGSNLELLIDAMANLSGDNISLHIVGDGEGHDILAQATEKYKWIHWYGNIYEEDKLLEIAERCIVGCYPGDAGLSILHYMALALPVITHDNMLAHMGPEPSYITDGVNGFLFSYTDKLPSLTALLQNILDQKYDILQAGEQAVATYHELTTPSLGKRLEAIMKEAGV